jgi:hypothetical protein
MAGIPLNTFKTKTFIVQPPPSTAPLFIAGPTGTGKQYPNPTDGRYKVYTSPLGTTGVVLYAQVANLGTQAYKVTLWHYRQNNVPFPYTELVENIIVPPNDSLVLLGGKLVLETSDSLFISGDAPVVTVSPAAPITNLKLTLSILESANQ